jgi:hypothetical protein
MKQESVLNRTARFHDVPSTRAIVDDLRASKMGKAADLVV